jgi:hypothetical protein
MTRGYLCLTALAATALAWGTTVTPRAAGAQIELATTPRISVAELQKLLGSGDVIVLDVRSEDTYARAHVPGAISVPLETVEARAKEWAGATKPIVTYCT